MSEPVIADFAAWLVVWPVLLPILAASLAVAAWGHGRAQALIGILGVAAQLLSAVLLFAHVWTNGPVVMSMGGWPVPFGIALVADVFGAGLTVAASLVAWFSLDRVGDAQAKVNEGSVPEMEAAFGVAEYSSELVAAAYQEMVLLESDPPSNEYTPGDFTAEAALELAAGFELGPEIVVKS